MPTVFGYGTLMNEASLKKTVPNAVNIRPALVYGFRRFFNLPSACRFHNGEKPVCVLNIENWEAESFINGVCFDFSEDDFDALKHRERFYSIFPVKAYCYKTNEEIDALVFQARDCDCYDFLHGSDEQIEYLKICYEGAKQFGDDFLDIFKSTTFIESKTLKELKL